MSIIQDSDPLALSLGWLPVPRGIRDSYLYPKPGNRFTPLEAFLDMSLSAAWKEHKVTVGNRVYQLMPGQFIGSIRALAARWTWDYRTVKAFCSSLKAQRILHYEVIHEIQHKGTLFTLLIFDGEMKKRLLGGGKYTAQAHVQDVASTTAQHTAQAPYNRRTSNESLDGNPSAIRRERMERSKEVRSKTSASETAAPSPQFQEVFGFFFDGLKAKLGEKPVFNQGALGKGLKSLLSGFGVEDIKARMSAWFNSTDPFIVNHSFSPELFFKNFNALGKGPIAPLVRNAHLNGAASPQEGKYANLG